MQVLPSAELGSMDAPLVPTVTQDVDYNRTYADLEDQIESLHGALATAYTPGHEALKMKYERAEARLKNAEAEAKHAEARAETAVAERDMAKAILQSELERREQMEGKVSELESICKKLTEDIGIKAEQLEKVKMEMDNEIEKFNQRSASQSAEENRLKNIITGKTEELGRAHNHLRDFSFKQDTLQTEMDSALKRLKAAVSGNKTAEKERIELLTKIEQLNLTITEKEEELKAMKTSIADKTAQIERLEKEATEKSKRPEEMIGDTRTTITEHKDPTEKSDDITVRTEAETEGNGEVSDVDGKLSQKLRDALQALEEKATENEKLLKDMLTFQKQSSTMKKDLNEVKKVSKRNETKLKSTVSDLKKRTSRIERQLEAKSTQLNDVESKLQESSSTKKKAETKASKLERRVKELERKHEEEEKKSKELQRDLKAVTSKEAERVQELASARKEWKRKVEMTARRLRIEEDRNAKLDKTCQELEENLKKAQDENRAYTLPSSAFADRAVALSASPAPLQDSPTFNSSLPRRASKQGGRRSSQQSVLTLEPGLKEDERRSARKSTRNIKSAESKPDGSATKTAGAKKRGRPAKRARDSVGSFRKSPYADSDNEGNDEEEVQVVKPRRSSRGNKDKLEEVTVDERPKKRRRVDVQGGSKKGVSKGDKPTSTKKGKVAALGAKVVRKVGGRTLRSRRPVSYDYSKAGRDIVGKLPGVEIFDPAPPPPLVTPSTNGTEKTVAVKKKRNSKRGEVVRRLDFDESGGGENGGRLLRSGSKTKVKIEKKTRSSKRR